MPPQSEVWLDFKNKGDKVRCSHYHVELSFLPQHDVNYKIFAKSRGISSGSDPFLTVAHNFRYENNLGNYNTSLERSDDYKTF